MSVEIPKDKLLWMYEMMVRIRYNEERAAEYFAAGKIPGFVHLYAGEEAVAVGVIANLRPGDYITSTHRGHGHFIAKGGDLKGMWAELLGKRTGVCKGKGGSMHIAEILIGELGANGIVGGGIPHAVGAALACKYLNKGCIAVAFFGDGAANQGTFHESLNLAAIWKLPVVFVCENNLYQISFHVKDHTSVKDIAERAKAYGIPGVVVDGQDVLAVYEVAKEAVERARRGEGPTLIEAKTYRYKGHFEGDPQVYRTKEEIEWWMKHKDPIKLFEEKLLSRSIVTKEELEKIWEKVKKEVDEAIKYAEESPWPDPKELTEDVFSTPTKGVLVWEWPI